MKISRRLFPLVLAACVLPLSQALLPGCATMFNGTKQEVRMRSRPEGAQVFLNGRRIGTTPTAAFVSRWGFHRVRIEMPGYEPYEVRLEKRYNTTASANVFIGGVWIIVDAMTGALFQLDVPEPARPPDWQQMVDRDLHPVNLSPPVYVVTHLKPDPRARRIGQMQRR